MSDQTKSLRSPSRAAARRTPTSGAQRRRTAGGANPPIRMQPFLWTILGLVVSLGLLTASLGGAFKVEHVRVVGANLPSQEIRRVSGLTGANIFTVRSDYVVSRLASVGTIAVRRVDTTFPNQVTIYARRRISMVGWRNGQALYLLDPDGRIIQQVRATKLPIIASRRTRGKLTTGVVTAVREAVRLLPREPNGPLAGFTYGPRHGLIIDGAAGWQAILGTGTPRTMVTRVATLASLLHKRKTFRTAHLNTNPAYFDT